MATPTAQAGAGAAGLIDVEQIAALLRCSARHVQRLAASGRMPEPILIGSLRRWQRATIDRWIEDGCPAISCGKEGSRAS